MTRATDLMRAFPGTRPLARWTIGPVKPCGMESLRESVASWRWFYGDAFDLVVCHNNLDRHQRAVVESLDVDAYEQSGDELSHRVPSPPLGPAWKLYPPRFRPCAHEVLIDNDVVIAAPLPQVDAFLARDDATVTTTTRDGYKCYGRFNERFDSPLSVNTGIFGVPPWFDLESAMPWWWLGGGWSDYLDEQALVAAALMGSPHIAIPRSDISYSRKDGVGRPVFHFIGINRYDVYTPGFGDGTSPHSEPVRFWHDYLASRGRRP